MRDRRSALQNVRSIRVCTKVAWDVENRKIVSIRSNASKTRFGSNRGEWQQKSGKQLQKLQEEFDLETPPFTAFDMPSYQLREHFSAKQISQASLLV